MPMHGAIDIDAYNARLAREAQQNERIAAIAAQRQQWLDERGLKDCLAECGEAVPVNAAKCPHCRRSQGLGSGGTASAARTVQIRLGGDA